MTRARDSTTAASRRRGARFDFVNTASALSRGVPGGVPEAAAAASASQSTAAPNAYGTQVVYSCRSSVPSDPARFFAATSVTAVISA
eukprot:CAMPEP_0197399318 /NCGR_PEP_ID=MMETSP1165-20131217/14965_1 /TAXON_ID=284809 /ORGANISM="Chrysocystis fragilis, Strain CCMP3189" /LENGTH=86 /DNA_ID=CAMNT_0042925313 /DNA_START=125 /DNA_END=385 /DNA_ORIENTATION=-